MLRKFFARRARVSSLRQQAEEAARQLHDQKPQVNRVSSWLENRKDQNGFGVDFEYTLRPRGAK